MPCSYESIKNILEVSYSGEGNKIARDFYIPVLKKSTQYYRLSGYFSVESLAITAAGLAGLIQNNGHMQLVVGAHDIKPDLIAVQNLTETKAKEIIEEIGAKIAEDLESLTDVFLQDRLKALAWMIVNGSVEIKVAIPRKTYFEKGNGIFHEKLLIMEDNDDCTISAIGSANETRHAYEMNGESLTIHMSWRPGASVYIDKHKKDFLAVWNNKHPDYLIFHLPEAIKLKLKERYYSESPPKFDPIEKNIIIDKEKLSRLLPVSRLISEIASIDGFIHLSLGTVRLYPHQTFTADFVMSHFPYRCLLADEVGLGKTLEAGAIIKRLLEERQVERILILSPKNVSRQWMEELYSHFGIKFRLFESSPVRRFKNPDGTEIRISKDESPFNYPGVDLLITSWHYARRDDIRDQITSGGRGFDLVIVDEAHAARKKRVINRPSEPTKLNDLCMELGISCPHILLLSATPVQLRSLEALDLLRILGLGGRWVHETNFERFYQILQKNDEDIEEDEWTFILQMVQSFSIKNLSFEELDKIIYSTIPEQFIDNVIRMMRTGENFGHIASLLKNEVAHEILPVGLDGELIYDVPKVQSVLRQFVMRLSPFQWYMVRNTRQRLTNLGFKFPDRVIQEEEVQLGPKHQQLLEALDSYLNNQYAAYEKLIRPEHRSTIGFVKCIYHQRFVSSFAASYQTIVNRLEFLDGLLAKDIEAMERVAEKIYAEEEDETDEIDYIEAVSDLLNKRDVHSVILEEKRVLEDLKSDLSEYAPGKDSLDDPKMKKIKDIISRLFHSEGRKVLVFSKYTDTIFALHKYLTRLGFNKSQIALYTGAGGQIYDSDQDQYQIVGKEEVMKALEGDRVGILLCTDAAAEGLNLQAASSLINVDMPWNPAKVEQRIGRVDRLGQKTSTVSIVNIWYPDSIEGAMYTSLFDRKEIYLLVVGPAQEIFSHQLRSAFDVNARGEQLKNFVSDTIKAIEDIKEDIAKKEGVFSGTQWSGEPVEDDEITQLTLDYISIASQHLELIQEIRDNRLYIHSNSYPIPTDIERWNGASIITGKPNALTPVHPLVQWISSQIIKEGHEFDLIQKYHKSLYIVKDSRRVGTMIAIDSDNIPKELQSHEVCNVMAELLDLARGES